MTNPSPRREWSPALSSIQRRRNRSIDTKDLLGLTSDLGIVDDEDFGIPMSPRKNKLPPGLPHRSPGSLAEKKKSKEKKDKKDKKKKKKDIVSREGGSLSPTPNEKEEVEPPPEIAAKLAICFDESLPIRDRLLVETEMRKNPEEREFLVHARYQRDRKKFVASAENLNYEHEEEVAGNIQKEAERAKKEKEEMDAERATRIREEKERKNREAKMFLDIRKGAAASVAKDAEEFRKNAERTAKITKKNIKEKKREEEEHTAHKKKILANEDSDVMRELKEAVLDQVDVPKR